MGVFGLFGFVGASGLSGVVGIRAIGVVGVFCPLFGVGMISLRVGASVNSVSGLDAEQWLS